MIEEYSRGYDLSAQLPPSALEKICSSARYAE